MPFHKLRRMGLTNYSCSMQHPYVLMLLENIRNIDDPHPWPKNTILIAGDTMINGINEKHISANVKSVKVRCFSGTTIDDMYFNLTSKLTDKPALVLHVGTNNSWNEISFQIYDKQLSLVHFVKENNPNCHVVLSSPIDRGDDGKATLTIKRLNRLLSKSSLHIIDNSNIGHSFLIMHGLHLNEHGVDKLALNFVKRIRSICNSGSAKQKLKEVHWKISSFWRSSNNPRSDKPEIIYSLSHNLNEDSMKCKKDLAFSTSKKSMIMSSCRK